MVEMRWMYHGAMIIAFLSSGLVFQSAQEAVSSPDVAELNAKKKFKCLLRALDNQNVEHVRELIKADAAYAQPSVFAQACRSGNIHLVTLLLEHHVQPNIPDEKGWYPVHHAAAGGHADILHLLKTQRAFIFQSTREFHDLPLHIAAYYGHTELVKSLLAITPGYLHVKSVNKDGVVHHIAASGNVELMEWYLGRDANDDEINRKDRHGMLPVFIAALHGRVDMVRYLLDRKPRHLKAKDNDGFQIMAAAVQENHVNLVNFLRSRGLKLSTKAFDNSTPAHLAAGNCYLNLVRQAIELDRMKPLVKDKQGWALIHYAARGGCLETIKMLHKEYSVDLNLEVREKDKRAIAHIAAAHNHTHILSYLNECGINVHAEDKSGRTPMQYARHAGARQAWGWLSNNMIGRARRA